jgi:N-acetylglucosaminyl-diphospho-decaprenol L-rhamnosyltransferase
MARPTSLEDAQLAAAALPVHAPRAVRNPATGRPRLSVVVVNYRQWDRTVELVRQLVAAPCVRRGDVEVVIVDNHSPPHPAVRRLRRHAGVSVRRWGSNRGFARAVNEGCRLSQGEWFLLLNPDTTLAEGFLDGVLELADGLSAHDPRAGIVGFHLRNADGSQQLSTGPFPTLASTLGRLLLPRRRRKYQTPRATERCRVPWVTGCCLLLRRACLQQLGGLDEEFFLYYEDVDLCLRAREQGWSVWYEPNLAVVHHHPLHCRPVPAVLRLVTRHSVLTYAAKHWPGWQFRLLGRIIRTEALARRLRAWCEGDAPQARVFAELGTLAAELCRGERRLAQERIRRAVGGIDVRVGV